MSGPGSLIDGCGAGQAGTCGDGCDLPLRPASRGASEGAEPKDEPLAAPPEEQREAARRRLERAIREQRLNRVDLYYWTELDVNGRRLSDVAREMMLSPSQVEQRLREARRRVREAIGAGEERSEG